MLDSLSQGSHCDKSGTLCVRFAYVHFDKLSGAGSVQVPRRGEMEPVMTQTVHAVGGYAVIMRI